MVPQSISYRKCLSNYLLRTLMATAFLALGLPKAFASDLVDTITNTIPIRLEGHLDRVTGLAFFPDGNRIASASWDGTARVWSISKRAVIGQFSGHESPLTAISVAPDGQRVVTGSLDGTKRINGRPAEGALRIWHPGTAASRAEPLERLQVGVLKGEGGAVEAVSFSPDGAWIGYGGSSRMVTIIGTDGLAPIASFDGHAAEIQALRFAKPSIIVSADTSGAVRQLSVDRNGSLKQPVRQFNDEKVRINTLEVWSNPMSRRAFDIMTSAADGSIRFWYSTSGPETHIPSYSDVFQAEAHSSFFLEGPALLLTVFRDGTYGTWTAGDNSILIEGDLGDNPYQRQLEVKAAILSGKFNPEAFPGIRLTKSLAALPSCRIQVADGAVSAAALSPDRKTLAVGYADGSIVIATVQDCG